MAQDLRCDGIYKNLPIVLDWVFRFEIFLGSNINTALLFYVIKNFIF